MDTALTIAGYVILWLFLAAIVLAVVHGGHRRRPCDDCGYCIGNQCFHYRILRMK